MDFGEAVVSVVLSILPLFVALSLLAAIAAFVNRDKTKRERPRVRAAGRGL